MSEPASAAAAAAAANSAAVAEAAAAPPAAVKQYWLVQLPPWVMEDWSRPRPPGSQIADVSVGDVDPVTGTPRMKIHLHTDDADIPLELDLHKRDGLKSMLVFDNAGGSDAGTPTAPLRCVDSLSLTCNALPTRNERYERYIDARKRKFDDRVDAPTTKKLLGRPTGTMFTPRPVGSFGSAAKRARPSSSGSSSSSSSAAAARRSSDGKVDRRVKNENVGVVKRQLLDLFQIKPYYSIGELGHATQQPSDWLKQILADVCVQDKQGPHRNHYHLNEKYSTGVLPPEPIE